jgi:hypothetical protein
MVTIPAISIPTGKRRSRSAAITEPRLWPTITSWPDRQGGQDSVEDLSPNLGIREVVASLFEERERDRCADGCVEAGDAFPARVMAESRLDGTHPSLKSSSILFGSIAGRGLHRDAG